MKAVAGNFRLKLNFLIESCPALVVHDATAMDRMFRKLPAPLKEPLGLSFRAITKLLQPSAFLSLIRGHDGEPPFCRRRS